MAETDLREWPGIRAAKNGAANGTRTRDHKIHKIVSMLSVSGLGKSNVCAPTLTERMQCGAMWHVKKHQEEPEIPSNEEYGTGSS